MARTLLCGLFAVVLLAAGTACGGGSNALTLEEYFEELQDIDDAQQERSDEAEEELDDAIPDDIAPDDELDDDTRETLQDGLRAQQDTLDEFTDDLDGLEPPEEVEDLHNELVDILREGSDRLSDVIDEAGEAETLEEFFEGFTDIESDFARADEICRELEQIAADEDIDVDLDCDEEGDDGTDDEPTPDDAEEEPTPEDEDDNGASGDDEDEDSGDGNEELESYLEEYNSISGEFAADAEERSNQFTADVEGVTEQDELSSLLDGFFTDFGSILDDIIADLEDLDAPDEAADLHDAQLAKLDEARQVVTDAQDRLAGATTPDEISIIAQEFGAALIDLGEELSQDCLDLQAVADDEGVDIDLNCE